MDDSRKRKRNVVLHQAPREELDTSKPTALFEATGKGRSHTLSIAIPGSIIANAQSHDLRTALAGRIARAAAVFCVDEIIVFNDGTGASHSHQQQQRQPRMRDFEYEDGYTGQSDPDHFLYHVLSYLECPPHLRQRLFPLHPNLQSAGSCPSLDMPHHLRQTDWCPYREGVTIDPNAQPFGQENSQFGANKKQKKSKSATLLNTSSMVDCGFPNIPVAIPVAIAPNTRVTIKLASPEQPHDFPYKKHTQPGEHEPLSGEPVDPAEPREEQGYYWGYTVRQAPTLSSIFTESPWEDGYDVSIGTSERGVPMSSIFPGPSTNTKISFNDKNGEETSRKLPNKYSHALVVFGGVAGLEAAAAADQDLAEKGIGKSNIGELFDFWVDACPGQGSRTIRTEEAVWLALSQLHAWVRGTNE
ncbi:hypothetical protein Vi05172_g59 [Venturia inaequalis]|uniref:DUF171-domain-containing protein n=1 Tax=Venturia inaequalis TaxID=5025 RepID=A0A8H3Z8G5_VENIN|nr:hypothetical protein EG327_004041 [Venturia inaequalis]RDI89503.1 hypothetical protein Vi05172_g59 [Venturia inaequalis]